MESFREILGRASFEVIEGDIRDRKAVRGYAHAETPIQERALDLCYYQVVTSSSQCYLWAQ